MGIFKAYDVRGIYQQNLFEKNAYLLGYYFIKYTNLKKIKLARDYRLSGSNLTKFFILGVLKANAKVEYQGQISTVNFYHSLFEGVNSGVVVTASHNDKEYNGFKFIVNGVSFDMRNGLGEVEKLVDENLDCLDYEEQEEFLTLPFEEFLLKFEIIENKKSLANYISFLYKFLNNIFSRKDLEILKSIKFSLDYSSGMSGMALVSLFNKLSFSNINHYNFMPDGNFPIHSPDPLKAQRFLEEQKNLGEFVGVFDGDGDRICFYNKNANVISQDKVIFKYIEEFSKFGNKFVVDLRVSKNIFDLAQDKKLNVEKLRVGRAFYQDYMKENDCFFGAELSGHLFFKEFTYLDNPDIALIYMLKFVLDNLKEVGLENFNFENILSHFSNYFKLQEINLKVKDADLCLNKLEKEFSNSIVSKMDGISFDLGNIWFNVRKSNTEPIIRINLEGNTQEEVIAFRERLEKLLN